MPFWLKAVGESTIRQTDIVGEWTIMRTDIVGETTLGKPSQAKHLLYKRSLDMVSKKKESIN